MWTFQHQPSTASSAPRISPAKSQLQRQAPLSAFQRRIPPFLAQGTARMMKRSYNEGRAGSLGTEIPISHPKTSLVAEAPSCAVTLVRPPPPGAEGDHPGAAGALRAAGAGEPVLHAASPELNAAPVPVAGAGAAEAIVGQPSPLTPIQTPSPQSSNSGEPVEVAQEGPQAASPKRNVPSPTTSTNSMVRKMAKIHTYMEQDVTSSSPRWPVPPLPSQVPLQLPVMGGVCSTVPGMQPPALAEASPPWPW